MVLAEPVRAPAPTPSRISLIEQDCLRRATDRGRPDFWHNVFGRRIVEQNNFSLVIALIEHRWREEDALARANA
jgi:hypothetical protein